MNDFDWDILQKKRIARNASKRVGQRKGCTLPSDSLTKAQRDKLNGEVISVTLNKPISWDDYKSLPKALQTEYINDLVKRYGVSITRISTELFKLSEAAVKLYNARNDVEYLKVKGGSIKFDAEGWKSFLSGNQVEEIIEAEEVIEPKSNDGEAAEDGTLDEFRFIFQHVTDMSNILALLGNLPLPDDARIYIEVKRGCESALS